MLNDGQPADIWSQVGSSSFRDYLQRKLVTDLTPFIQKNNFDLGDFIPAALEPYKVNGKIMALPHMMGGAYFLFNKDLFDQAGVDYPPTSWDNKSWTWDALLEKRKTLARAVDEQKDVTYCTEIVYIDFASLVWIWGQDLFPSSAYQTGLATTHSLDSPKAAATFQARSDLFHKYKYAPGLNQQTTNYFASKQAFSSLGLAVALYQLADITGLSLGMAALPWGAEGRRNVFITEGWMISSQSSHSQEAWTVLKYLTSAEVQKSWMAYGPPPVRKSLLEEWYDQFPRMSSAEVKKVYQGSLKYSQPSPSSSLMGLEKISKVFNDTFLEFWIAPVNPADTLQYYGEKLNTVLADIRSTNKK